jgi:hypothetical protein
MSNLAESTARDVLMKKNEEIAHLHMELQNTQQVLQTALQERDEWMYLAEGTYEMHQFAYFPGASYAGDKCVCSCFIQ